MRGQARTAPSSTGAPRVRKALRWFGGAFEVLGAIEALIVVALGTALVGGIFVWLPLRLAFDCFVASRPWSGAAVAGGTLAFWAVLARDLARRRASALSYILVIGSGRCVLAVWIALV